MYRAAIEYILGFKLAGDRLRIDPCIPRFWREFEITYRRGNTTYRIKVENPQALSRGIASVEVNGQIQPGNEVAITDDGRTYEIRVVLGEKPLPKEDETASVEKPATEHVAS
jgi:cyclic beta-1,2-glucan synthetase